MLCRLSEVRLTDVRRNTSQDDLLLARSLNRFPELRVIPSVDFALTRDDRHIWVHVENGFRQRSVGSGLCRRREHDWKIEQLSKPGVGKHGVVVQGRVEVASAVWSSVSD
jgi:hypothetical protein